MKKKHELVVYDKKSLIKVVVWSLITIALLYICVLYYYCIKGV
jgi:hypothetical protein